jgi:hypothetical protein
MAGATLPALLANGLLVNTAEQLSTVDPAFRCRIKVDFI